MKQSRREFLVMAGALVAAGTLPLYAFAADKTMKIGIVGSGNVGSAIGASWVRAGHEVMFSSLDIEHDKALAARLGGGARAGTPREAAAFGEVLMISVPYHALPAVGKDLGELLKGKIVIDTCNPFVTRDGETGKWALEKGAGLASKELLRGARIVRAFNAIAAARMGAAYQEPGRIGMPIASDDAQAVELASRLIRDVGYEPVLVGGLEKGKHLMPGTALSGERSAEEIRKIAAGLN
jgi:predicted dinucleotide-binding enzyme